MRIRLGALVAAALALVGAAEARAGLGGLGGGCCVGSPAPACGDAQCNVAACQNQLRPVYKVVYDSVKEKRTKVCYETVKETVMKPVCKTCYREECRGWAG